MDSLEQLPIPEGEISQNEERIVNKYFGDDNRSGNGGGSPPPKAESKSMGFAKALKITGILAFIFIIVANPWVDGIFCKIPYCGSKVGSLAVKTLIYAIVVLAALYFMG